MHEFGLRFNSQFVNLYLDAADYIKYLKNFDHYNSIDLVFNKELSKNYPVANLDDLIIHFVHYKTFEDAKNKWEERKKRINKDNLFVIFTEQESCSKQNLIDFDNLPFENKVVFTCKRYENIKNSVFVKRYYGSEKGVFMFYEYVNKYSKRRKYDIFDWVSWFNGETDLKKLDKQR